ncbi:UBX domain-containing protein 7-like [Dermacentor silvarum]|uniref:UBX domain-containing protein 7-like n=1 Tax=Dermacentor silvarum TaxID=543639 RepID=UPI00189A7580|nr:UBX domain-containing protein 7-like [Dermacentor silvarum]
MASSSASSNINLIENFCAVTGADENVAKQMLEACNGNLEMAINMHVDSDWTQPSNSHTNEAALASSSDMPPPPVAAPDDDVRPPIPPVREVLVDGPFPYGYPAARRATYSVFDRFRDFQAETRLQEEKLLQGDTDSPSYKKRKTLEDLFRPPLDLMHRGSFESAREVGRTKNRWLMVNVQNVQEFACQVLNRDVWSNSTIKSIISEHFVFWQVYQDSEEGQRYVLFYKVVDYPYVAILDPRTGEKVLSWNQVDAVKFCDAVTEFLAEHPTPDGSAVNPPTKKVKPTVKKESIVEEDEESQMRAAIEASLRESSARTHESASDDDQSDLETFDSDTEAGPAHASNHSRMQVDSPPPTRDDKTKGETSTAKSDVDEWKRFLGSESDEKSEVMIRFPDGSRKVMSFPCTSKLKALILYASSNGFGEETHELVTNFPRRNLSELDHSLTLRDVGLFPKETLFIQLRNS